MEIPSEIDMCKEVIAIHISPGPGNMATPRNSYKLTRLVIYYTHETH